MFIEIVCSITVAASAAATWRSVIAQRASALNADRAQRSAVASRCHSLAALSHAKSCQKACEKSEASATRSADNAGVLLQLVANNASTPRIRTTRGEAYDAVAEQAAAAENKEAIKSANLAAQSPSWLKKWQQTNS